MQTINVLYLRFLDAFGLFLYEDGGYPLLCIKNKKGDILL